MLIGSSNRKAGVSRTTPALCLIGGTEQGDGLCKMRTTRECLMKKGVPVRKEPLQPLAIRAVPGNGFDDSLFKGNGGRPSQTFFEFGGIDCVAANVSLAIRHKGNQALG